MSTEIYGGDILHGVTDPLVILLARTPGFGWISPQCGDYVTTPKYVERESVDEIIRTENPDEIAVVGLMGGGWETIWARNSQEVSYPRAEEPAAPKLLPLTGEVWQHSEPPKDAGLIIIDATVIWMERGTRLVESLLTYARWNPEASRWIDLEGTPIGQVPGRTRQAATLYIRAWSRIPTAGYAPTEGYPYIAS